MYLFIFVCHKACLLIVHDSCCVLRHVLATLLVSLWMLYRIDQSLRYAQLIPLVSIVSLTLACTHIVRNEILNANVLFKLTRLVRVLLFASLLWHFGLVRHDEASETIQISEGCYKDVSEPCEHCLQGTFLGFCVVTTRVQPRQENTIGNVKDTRVLIGRRHLVLLHFS